MYPESFSEQLMYSTVRLVSINGNIGTGFFFVFELGDIHVPILVTNRHVINNNPSEVVFCEVHTGDYDKKEVDEISQTIKLENGWRFHPTQDLCYYYMNPLIMQVNKQLNRRVIFCYIQEENLITKSELESLNAIESVLMVGYPKGLWNEKHNFPLFRTGITASHPAVDFNEVGIGVVDMACFPGSSGSPIFISDENGYVDKKGNIHVGHRRNKLLGILFEGPVMDIEGKIIVETQSHMRTKSSIMINLGYYIRSEELLVFKEMIIEDLKAGL